MEEREQAKTHDDLTAPVAGGFLATAELANLFVHGGLLGAGAGLLGAAFVYWKGKPYIDQFKRLLLPLEERLPQRSPGERSFTDRLLARFPEPEEKTLASHQDLPEEELLAPRRKRGMFLFSQVLSVFRPSLDRIYLGTLEDGTMLFCAASELCHVALAGTTRGGKSTIMRMLAAQLCYAGAGVLLLNPHHSRYLFDKKEDWTPFEGSDASGHPYLLYPPMDCRHYDVIEHYLRQIVEVKLTERKERVANGHPAGKPFFLILDELPDIVKHVSGATGYLDDLIRQGAKYNLFVISASQDFLVKTLKLESGEARECYRTAYYVGGGGQTAKILLDGPVEAAIENLLGAGTVLLRNFQVCKKATLASVPYVDNGALYTLLGPSTYQPEETKTRDEALSEPHVDSPQSEPSRRYGLSSAYAAHQERKHALHTMSAQASRAKASAKGEPADGLRQDERQVLEAYRAGQKSGMAIKTYLAQQNLPMIGLTRIIECLHRLASLGLVDWQPQKK